MFPDKQHQVLSDFFDNAPIGLHWQLRDGTIQAANHALARLLGYEPGELADANFFGFFEDLDTVVELRERLAAGETVDSQKIELRARDGSKRHVLFSASVLMRDGAFVRARCFTRDIPLLTQAMQELANANARKTAILEASLDAIITMDARGYLLDFNDAAQRIFGYSRQEAMQQRLSTLIIPPRFREAHERGLRRYLETGEGPVLGKRIEIQAMRKNGDEFPVELSIAVAAGDPPLFTATLRDITQRQKAEQALQETLTALQLSQADLHDADRRKDEFIATLAHELRNPLSPLRTAAEILTRPNVSPEWARRSVDVIRRQVAVMSRLLDDLLDVARITRGKLELRREAVQVLDILRLACDTVQPLLDAKQQRLQTDFRGLEGVIVVLDQVRIAQVLSNLLVNASKYSDSDCSVLLRSWIRDRTLGFEVVDEGIGFRPEVATELFQMFSQLPEAVGRDEGGLGIGLSLSLGLVRLHGGVLEAFSRGPNLGATFTVRLPLDPEDAGRFPGSPG